MSVPSDPRNPYASPSSTSRLEDGTPGLPVFAKTTFFIDLVLCGLRVPLVLFSLLGYLALKRGNHPLLPTAAADILIGFGIIVFGLPTSVCALLRKPWAVTLGWFTVVTTLGSLGLTIWLATSKIAELGPNTVQTAGIYIGIGLGLLFRVVWLATYIGALVQFSRWVKRLSPTLPSSS